MTFTTVELFGILERLATIMFELSKYGIFLCDLKEENIILSNLIEEEAEREPGDEQEEREGDVFPENKQGF